MKRLAVAVLGCAAVAAHAQQPLPMGVQEVTESAITDALAPSEAASGPRARGFKPVLRRTSSASVLITFVTGSAELTAESRAALDTVARAMRGDRLAPLSFRVEGHADPRGEAALNRVLSQARAESVVAYLTREHGIERQRLLPAGRGADEPLNRSDPAAPENRRVTFVTLGN